MQSIVDLARVSRERRSINLKTPLKTLVVIHPSQEYLDDVRGLEDYITKELNVRDLILSSDEDKWNVSYSVSADWPTLGKKLKKDAQKVKKALPSLASDDVKRFVTEKQLTVDGINLEAEDLIVKRGIDANANPETKNWETNTDEDVLIILDAEMYNELKDEGLAREIVNRVQRLRKKAGLKATDDVKMEYSLMSDPDKLDIDKVFETKSGIFEKALRRGLDRGRAMQGDTAINGVDPETKDENLIMEEEQEVQKATFMLRLLRL